MCSINTREKNGKDLKNLEKCHFSSSSCSNHLNYCYGMVKWLMRRTSNLRIASRMGPNPVRDKSLFP